MKPYCYFDSEIFEISLAYLITRTYKMSGFSFTKALKLYNCFVSGSVILSVLYQKELHKGIDVFCSLDPQNNLFRDSFFFGEIKPRKLPDMEPTDFEKYLETMGFKLVSTDLAHPYFNVNYYRTYKKDGFDMPIHIIRMADNSSKKEVIEKFDINICMNYFDGKLYCANKRDLMEKKMTITFKKDTHKSVYSKRMKKYKKMGFREGCRIDENYMETKDEFF